MCFSIAHKKLFREITMTGVSEDIQTNQLYSLVDGFNAAMAEGKKGTAADFVESAVQQYGQRVPPQSRTNDMHAQVVTMLETAGSQDVIFKAVADRQIEMVNNWFAASHPTNSPN
jgi:hypothetical protein